MNMDIWSIKGQKQTYLRNTSAYIQQKKGKIINWFISTGPTSMLIYVNDLLSLLLDDGGTECYAELISYGGNLLTSSCLESTIDKLSSEECWQMARR